MTTPVFYDIQYQLDDIPVIFENDNYVVINKPPNYHIDGTYSHTVRSWCIKTRGYAPHFVNQLDYPTSGLMVLAKNSRAAGAAGKQFQARAVIKAYIALVHGEIETQTVSAPISDDTTDPHAFRMCVSDLGRPSKTHIQRLCAIKSYQSKDGEATDARNVYTLISLHPVTGRRHQLRVHLKHIGHPIVGDKTYGAQSCITEVPSSKLINGDERLCLHALTLSIPGLPELPVLHASIQFPNDLLSIIYNEARKFEEGAVSLNVSL